MLKCKENLKEFCPDFTDEKLEEIIEVRRDFRD